MEWTENAIQQAERECVAAFEKIEANENTCFEKVLAAMQAERIGVQHFAPTTGYGYDDVGRDTLERVYARVLGAEAALVRPQIVSGTHALAIAFFGLLRPGKRLVSAAGKPYDTLEKVIGIDGNTSGSLADWGVAYTEVALVNDMPDIRAISNAIDDETGCVLIQRSRGYDWRPSLSLTQIGEICAAIRAKNPAAAILVDNCYGEFTCADEPLSVGADIIVGSLIKNPGGGIAPTGGYAAGRAAYVEKIADRLTSPGIGGEVGSYAGSYQPFYQGLFMAPHTVAQALKGAVLAARVFENAGFAVSPGFQAERHDIIQAIRLDAPEKLIAFCQAIQASSPIDSYAMPEPWDMPGYQHQVIMAAGTFVSGASIELSADGPMRPPYIAYLQGGLTYAHCRYAISKTLSAITKV